MEGGPSGSGVWVERAERTQSAVYKIVVERGGRRLVGIVCAQGADRARAGPTGGRVCASRTIRAVSCRVVSGY